MRFLDQHNKPIALVGPLVVFFLLGAVIPHHSEAAHIGSQIDAGGWLALVIARVVVIGAVLGVCWRLYLQVFPFQIDRWGWLVGVLGGALWIAVCGLRIEPQLLSLLGLSETALGQRAGVNPFELYESALSRGIFFGFRFALLVLIVPLAEELFLRGFLMRVVDSDDWIDQPLATLGTAGLITGTVYGVLTHPSEFMAAALWFSLITWMMVRTGKFWNCVVAHAVTNLIVGVYLSATHSWHLW